MKIGMMTAWNTDSGTAIHAEAIGRAWIKAGHELAVFSHIKNDFHGTGFTGIDEYYVTRCFGTQKTGFLNTKPLLSCSFDIFVVQDLRMLPVQNLYDILPRIKSGLKVNVLYENHLPQEKWFFEAEWDRLVYFDKRQKFFRKKYPDAEYIPFPCFPRRSGNKLEARKKLGLPEDKKIIYMFCQRGYQPLITEIPLELREDAVLLIVSQSGYSPFKEKPSGKHLILREKNALSDEMFDDYLFASDACILHKISTGNLAVVSSTAFQAIGTGCPLVAPAESDFFSMFDKEIMKYDNPDDLNRKLIELLINSSIMEEQLKNAENFTDKYSSDRIAEMFLK